MTRKVIKQSVDPTILKQGFFGFRREAVNRFQLRLSLRGLGVAGVQEKRPQTKLNTKPRYTIATGTGTATATNSSY
jgi:hypothetical protein